jgi:hypothetical protein
MLSRVSAAAGAAAVAVMLAAPAPSSARGGAAMGHVGTFHPPVSSFHRAPPSFAHAHRGAPIRHDIERRVEQRQVFGATLRRHQRAVGLSDLGGYWAPLTTSDDGSFYGYNYVPSDMSGWMYPPVPKVPAAAVIPVAARYAPIPDRGGCRSETVAMPSSDSAERNVTITRC